MDIANIPQPLSDERRAAIRVVHLQVTPEVGDVEIAGPPVGFWDGLTTGVGRLGALVGGTLGCYYAGPQQALIYLPYAPVAPFHALFETISRDHYDRLTAPIREQVATAPAALRTAMLESIQQCAPFLVASDDAAADGTIAVGVSRVLINTQYADPLEPFWVATYDHPLAMWIEVSVALHHGDSAIHEFLLQGLQDLVWVAATDPAR